MGWDLLVVAFDAMGQLLEFGVVVQRYGLDLAAFEVDEEGVGDIDHDPQRGGAGPLHTGQSGTAELAAINGVYWVWP